MELREEILKEHSKRQTVAIAGWVGGSKARFTKLMELFLHGEYRVTQRAVWIISTCADTHPELLPPWFSQMIEKMQEDGVHDAVRRNVLRILATSDIPKKLHGKVIAVCFDELGKPESPIAVKVHAMKTLGNLARYEPDIIGELRDTIGLMLTQQSAVGLYACGRNVLKKLEK